MASFAPNKIDTTAINGGQRYQNGDVVDANAINAPIEASAWAQQTAEEAQVKADYAIQKVNDAEIGEITLSAYPIGSVYISVSETSPALLFGGDWEALQDRFLLGAGSLPVNLLGGRMNLQLSAAIGAYNNDTSSIGYAATGAIPNMPYTYGGNVSNQISNISSINHSTVVYDWEQGTTTPSLYPPYLTVYMWKRIG